MQSRHNAVMKVLTVRNVPDDLYALLTRRAEAHRRSLQQEALMLLERARTFDESVIHRARAIRQRLAGRSLGDMVNDVRAERQR